MSLFKKLLFRPHSLQWKLILINTFVISLVFLIAGVSVKDFACLLVGKYSLVGEQQANFNRTMHYFLLWAGFLAMLLATMVHYFSVRSILTPLKKLNASTHAAIQTKHLSPLPVSSTDEIGELTKHVNRLITTLKETENNRKQTLHDLSHELRTPLTNLRGYMEALHSGLLQGNPELYRMLYQESVYLTKLINQLNQYTEDLTKSPCFENVDIKRLMLNALQDSQQELQTNQIDVHTTIESAMLLVDQDAIKQVMNQLLINAIRYNHGLTLFITGKKVKDSYLITITNRGQSIPNNLRKYLFEPFFRIDPSRQRETGGLGLGLAVVKQIVERHGGKVGLSSHENKHTFWFHIPTTATKEA